MIVIADNDLPKSKGKERRWPQRVVMILRLKHTSIVVVTSYLILKSSRFYSRLKIINKNERLKQLAIIFFSVFFLHISK